MDFPYQSRGGILPVLLAPGPHLSEVWLLAVGVDGTLFHHGPSGHPTFPGATSGRGRSASSQGAIPWERIEAIVIGADTYDRK